MSKTTGNWQVRRLSDYVRTGLRNVICPETQSARLFVLLLAVIILLLRKSDALLNPQFWAEDGTIFFLQQYEYGASASIYPYAGYLHLLPRLIAVFAQTFFSYSAIPAVYNYASLLVTLWVVFSVFSPRLKAGYPGALALAIVLIPHYGNEVYLNVTNLQWFLCILLVVTVVKEVPDEKYGRTGRQVATDLSTVFVCGLTGPFLVFMAPLFVWKWVQNKNKYSSSMLRVVALVVMVQLFFMSSEAVQPGSASGDMGVYSQLLGARVFGGLFLGALTSHFNPHVLTVMYLLLMFYLFYRVSRRKMNLSVFLYMHIVILLATIYKFKAMPEVLLPPQNGTRYFFIPYIMVVWSLVVLLEHANKKARMLLAVALCLIALSSFTSRFQSGYVDYEWRSYSERIGREDVLIPINPPGWQINVDAH